MTRRNKILLGTLIAAVLALLIALCFVGNTFARFTSTESSSASVSIAAWEVDFDDSVLETNMSASKLSPSGNEFEGVQRTNDNFVLAATLTNKSDVAATVSVAVGSTVTVTYQDAGYNPEDDTTNYGPTEATTTASAAANELSSHFSVEVYWSDSNAFTSVNGTVAEHTLNKFSMEADDGGSNPTLKAYDSVNETADLIYIYFDITWISDLESTTSQGTYENGDGFDTWAGENVSKFDFSVTITYVQSAA